MSFRDTKARGGVSSRGRDVGGAGSGRCALKAFEPGLLAKANRGILYVDEVNLLDDHLVDVLLDSAASGCRDSSLVP